MCSSQFLLEKIDISYWIASFEYTSPIGADPKSDQIKKK